MISVSNRRLHHWHTVLIALCFISTLIISPLASLAASIPSTTTNTNQDDGQSVPLYGLFEADLPVVTPAKNVYDPKQLEVNVQFTAPDSTRIVVPAFWMQPYQQTCAQECAVELLKPQGAGGWKVRFTPTQVGNWSYIVQERDQVAIRTSSSGRFTVTASDAKGFIGVGSNHHYFAYGNDTPYFVLGSNVGWSWNGANNTLGYQNWLKTLKESGANFARLYIDVPWFIGLGWKGPIGDFTAIQSDAWRFDQVLKTAEEQGIALQVVILWYQGYTTYTPTPVNVPTTPGRPDTSADWSTNPINVTQGGSISGPALFFATDAGKTLFKQRLRYIAARWGYSPNIFAWEMIDQLDRVSTNDFDPVSTWLKEMTTYMRTVDANHMITAGVRESARASLLDRAVLDFKQVRYYQRRPIETAIDQVSGTLSVIGPVLANADRPVLLNEFSLSSWYEPTADDPTGVHVRETMWATALSGAAGSGSSWWWDTYLFPQNLTAIFPPIAAFVKGIPFNTGSFVPVSVSLGGDAVNYSPVRVEGYTGSFNGPKAPDATFTVTADGVTPPISQTTSYLYGTVYNKDSAQPQKYIITPPVDTTLTVSVSRVSERGGAALAITIDDKLAGQITLSPNSPPAQLTVPISAGEHTVVINNTGPDFLQISSLVIAQYTTPLRAVSLADRTQGIFLSWLQHRDYTWENVAKNVNATPVMSTMRVDGMPLGQYRVEQWDPFTGNVLGSEDVTVQSDSGDTGSLMVELLPISKMLAIRAFHIGDSISNATPPAVATP
jgi:hypothetical protein